MDEASEARRTARLAQIAATDKRKAAHTADITAAAEFRELHGLTFDDYRTPDVPVIRKDFHPQATSKEAPSTQPVGDDWNQWAQSLIDQREELLIDVLVEYIAEQTSEKVAPLLEKISALETRLAVAELKRSPGFVDLLRKARDAIAS